MGELGVSNGDELEPVGRPILFRFHRSDRVRGAARTGLDRWGIGLGPRASPARRLQRGRRVGAVRSFFWILIPMARLGRGLVRERGRRVGSVFLVHRFGDVSRPCYD